MVERNRNYCVDLVRLIATFGVIAFHVSSETRSAEVTGKFFTLFYIRIWAIKTYKNLQNMISW